VQGLADIHEAGFVQGDFTLSNIVIDSEDDVQIIDINRRGCPVGWEPPELGRLIDSGQRIGMCIGVKTDLFQLGMVLWALAAEEDEPERVARPLPLLDERLPSYYSRVVEACLSERPQGRMEAKRLLKLFPANAGTPPSVGRPSVDFSEHVDVLAGSRSTNQSHRSDKEYIDPDWAVTLDEVRRGRADTSASTDFTSGQVTYLDPDSNAASTNYRFESSGSWVVGHSRGRSPVSSRRRRSSPYGRPVSSQTSLSSTSPDRRMQGERCDADRCDNDERPHEPTDAVSYPRSISDEDLHQRSEHGAAEKKHWEAGEEPKAPASLADRRLADLRNDEYAARLMHTDSGFDEQMMEELTLQEPSQPGRNDANYDRSADTCLEDKAIIPGDELPTPGSFYSAKASPATDLLAQRAHDDHDVRQQ
jgi:hypothetical protein